MYITGQRKDFASRLHQCATDNTSLSGFLSEGNSYVSRFAPYESGKWEKEARLAKYRLTNVSANLYTQQFNTDSIRTLTNFKKNLTYGSGQIFDSNRPRYANGYLYLMDNSGMFYILDVTNNVDNATLVGSINLAAYAPFDFVVGGATYCYFLGNTGDIIVVNVSNPASPSVTNVVTCSDPTQGPQPSFIEGRYLYVPCGFNNGGGDGKTFIYSLANPALPVETGVFTFPNGGDPRWAGMEDPENPGSYLIAPGNWGFGGYFHPCIKGNYLYVLNYFSNYLATQGGQGQGYAIFYVVDISNKANPTLVREVSIPQGTDVVGNYEPWRAGVVGNYLYVCDDRNIAYLSLSDPSNPQYLGMAVSSNGDTEGVCVVGNTLFWTCNTSNNIIAWDISTGIPIETVTSASFTSLGLTGASNGFGVDKVNRRLFFMVGGKLCQASY